MLAARPYNVNRDSATAWIPQARQVLEHYGIANAHARNRSFNVVALRLLFLPNRFFRCRELATLCCDCFL